MKVKQSCLVDVLTHPAPINAAAKKELSPDRSERMVTWEQPELCRVPFEIVRRRNPSRRLIDFTGTRMGTSVVVGLHHWVTKGGKWIVRCGCGRHQVIHGGIIRTVTRGRRDGWVCTECFRARKAEQQ
jgi:hypothetical protein